MSALATEAPQRTRPSETNDYAILKQQIKAAGLLESRSSYYWLKTALALATLGASAAIAVLSSVWWVLLLDAAFMGFAFTQIALLAHDIGHRQGYRGRRTNRIARAFFGNVLLGVSHSWWNDKHNQHHATPNHIDLRHTGRARQLDEPAEHRQAGTAAQHRHGHAAPKPLLLHCRPPGSPAP